MGPTTRRGEGWIGLLVAAAITSVIALAVSQGRRKDPASARHAVALDLPRLGGGRAPLPRGKVTLVDFWATWCAPCRASMPRLQRVWQQYRGDGVEIYSVDTDDPGPEREPGVREFLLENHLTFPVVLDDGDAVRAFSIGSLPTLLLLDRQGQVAWSHVGALGGRDETDLRAALDHALGR